MALREMRAATALPLDTRNPRLAAHSEQASAEPPRQEMPAVTSRKATQPPRRVLLNSERPPGSRGGWPGHRGRRAAVLRSGRRGTAAGAKLHSPRGSPDARGGAGGAPATAASALSPGERCRSFAVRPLRGMPEKPAVFPEPQEREGKKILEVSRLYSN